MAEKKQPDWEKIELDYRAGIKTLREIASEHGISAPAITKRAKRDEWSRDLTAKIAKKADELVNKKLVNKLVNKEKVLTEREIVNTLGNESADVQIVQRKDLSRFHRIANNLFEEIEALTGTANANAIEQLSSWIENEGLTGEEGLVMFNKISSLPNRVKMAKDLADTLGKLIPLERTVYKMDVEQKDATDPLTELLKEIGKGRNSFSVVQDDPEYNTAIDAENTIGMVGDDPDYN